MQKIYRQLAETNLAFFCQLLRPPEADPGTKFLIGPHHEAWARLLVRHKRLCILAARDHGKSIFMSFAFPIWMASKHPNRSGYILSGSQRGAEKMLGFIRHEIETNSKLSYLDPPDRTVWSADRIKLANGHTIYARGYDARVRGGHPVWIVLDDVLNDETSFSETGRQRDIEYFYSAVTNMIVPGGQIVVVGTPFHAQDLYGDLRTNEEYHYEEFPAFHKEKREVDGVEVEEDVALWSDRYAADALKKRKREIGSLRFAREFLCKPVSDEASLFPMGLFRGIDVEMPDIRLGMTSAFWDRNGVHKRYIGVDLAMSSSVEADFTVIWCVGVDKYGNHWLVDVDRQKGLAFQEQLSRIVSMARRYAAQMVYIEDNQFQRVVGDELIRTTALSIQKVRTGSEKHSFDEGLPSLRIMLENRKIRIPRGDERSVTLTDTWIAEMHSFTFVKGKAKSTGAHDDMAMAFLITAKAIRDANFSFAFEEEPEDQSAYEQMLRDSGIDPVTGAEISSREQKDRHGGSLGGGAGVLFDEVLDGEGEDGGLFGGGVLGQIDPNGVVGARQSGRPAQTGGTIMPNVPGFGFSGF